MTFQVAQNPKKCNFDGANLTRRIENIALPIFSHMKVAYHQPEAQRCVFKEPWTPGPPIKLEQTAM